MQINKSYRFWLSFGILFLKVTNKFSFREYFQFFCLMIRKQVFLIFLFFVFFISVRAQYVNTDSLVIVPGEPFPLTISEVELKHINLSGPQFDCSQTAGIMLSKFAFPVRNKIISRFGPRHGRMHKGLDIRSATGDTIRATFEGRVISACYHYGFGNLIIIQHAKNIKTYYAHLSKFLIKNGAWVSRNEPIGRAGSTGRATGSHLHFEIRENNYAYDPELVYDFKTGRIRSGVELVKSIAQLQRRLIPKGYSVNLGVPQYYMVRRGDSLWRISRRYKMSISHICRMNKISNNSVLRVGQALKLY
jgi:LysM repeat protein